jgi:hypothetical protein
MGIAVPMPTDFALLNDFLFHQQPLLIHAIGSIPPFDACERYGHCRSAPKTSQAPYSRVKSSPRQQRRFHQNQLAMANH